MLLRSGKDWDDSQLMLHCKGCGCWFHSACLNVDVSYARESHDTFDRYDLFFLLSALRSNTVPHILNYELKCHACTEGNDLFQRVDTSAHILHHL